MKNILLLAVFLAVVVAQSPTIPETNHYGFLLERGPFMMSPTLLQVGWSYTNVETQMQVLRLEERRGINFSEKFLIILFFVFLFFFFKKHLEN